MLNTNQLIYLKKKERQTDRKEKYKKWIPIVLNKGETSGSNKSIK